MFNQTGIFIDLTKIQQKAKMTDSNPFAIYLWQSKAIHFCTILVFVCILANRVNFYLNYVPSIWLVQRNKSKKK